MTVPKKGEAVPRRSVFERVSSGFTTPAFESFTNSQLKTLLLLASHQPSRSTSISVEDQVARVVSDLAELAGRFGVSSEQLLTRAVLRETPGRELKQIKNVAKELLKNAENKPQREAASLVYHLAIAAAFARHGLEISSRVVTERRTLYYSLATAFSGHVIGEVFHDAVRAIDAARG